MDNRNLYSIKELAEKLGISELDAYNLVILSKNEVTEIDGEYFAPDYALDQAEVEFNKYWSISELEREVGISEGDLKYMCECNIQYDLPEYMKVRPVSLCGTYFVHQDYIDTLMERYASFNEEADTIMYKIDMGIDDDDFMDRDFGGYQYEEEDDTSTSTPETPKDPDDDIIEEIIIIEEQDPDAKKKDKKKKALKKQELEGYRKRHEEEVARAVAARLRDDAQSKLQAKYGSALPTSVVPATPYVPETHKPSYAPVDNKPASDVNRTPSSKDTNDYQGSLDRAKKAEDLKQEQIKAEEYRKEQERIADEKRREHQKKVSDALGDKYKEGTDTTGKYAEQSRLEKIEQDRERLKKEQDEKQREINEEGRRQRERENKEEIARQERDRRDREKSTTVVPPVSHKPSDVKPTSETPKTDYKPNETPKSPTSRPSETPKSSVEGARNDSQRYDTPKHEEPKYDNRNPYENRHSQTEGGSTLNPNTTGKINDPVVTRPSESGSVGGSTHINPDYKSNINGEPKREENKEYKPYTPVSSTEPSKYQEPKKNEPSITHTPSTSTTPRDTYGSDNKYGSDHRDQKPDYRPSETPKTHEPAKTEQGSGYTTPTYRPSTEGARQDTVRGQEPKHETPKTDTRNPYENRQSPNENEYKNRNDYKPSEPQRTTPSQTQRPSETPKSSVEGARVDATRGVDTKQPDVRNPYENRTQEGIKQDNKSGTEYGKTSYGSDLNKSHTSTVNGGRDNQSHRTEPSRQEEPRTADVRNSYENKTSSTGKGSIENKSHIDNKIDDRKPSTPKSSVDGARTDTIRGNDTRHSTSQPDTRNPYENKGDTVSGKTSYGSDLNKNRTATINGEKATGSQNKETVGSYNKEQPSRTPSTRQPERTEGARSDATRGAEHREEKPVQGGTSYRPVTTTKPADNRGIQQDGKTVGGSTLNGTVQKGTVINGDGKSVAINKPTQTGTVVTDANGKTQRVITWNEAFDKDGTPKVIGYAQKTSSDNFYITRNPKLAKQFGVEVDPAVQSNTPSTVQGRINRNTQGTVNGARDDALRNTSNGGEKARTCPICKQTPCVCGRKSDQKNTREYTIDNNGKTVITGVGKNQVCPKCKQNPCICGHMKDDAFKSHLYQDDEELKEARKRKGRGIGDDVAGLTAIALSPFISRDITGGVSTVGRVVGTAGALGGMFLGNDEPSQKAMQSAMQKSIVQGTSSQNVYLKMMHKRAELSINKVNTYIDEHNLTALTNDDKISRLDPTLGLKVNTRDIKLQSKELQELLTKHGQSVHSLNSKNTKTLLNDPAVKKNAQLRNEIKKNIQFNEYLQKNGVDLDTMDSLEIALMMNGLKDKSLKTTLMNRTGVVGFRDKLAIEYKKVNNGRVRVSTKQIRDSKTAIEKLLLKDGIVVRNRSTDHLMRL